MTFILLAERIQRTVIRGPSGNDRSLIGQLWLYNNRLDYILRANRIRVRQTRVVEEKT